jgi:hypothetical protein
MAKPIPTKTLKWRRRRLRGRLMLLSQLDLFRAMDSARLQKIAELQAQIAKTTGEIDLQEGRAD